MVAVVWITWGVMLFDWHAAIRFRRQVRLDPERPVVCLGDSLTAGMPPYGSYAQSLQKLITVPVVSLGQDGITSADALDKLPAVVEANPQAVVVELGGHDFLKGHGRAGTQANLERIIKECRTIGADVILSARFMVEDVPPFQDALSELSNGTLQAEVVETNQATIMPIGLRQDSPEDDRTGA